MSTLLMHPRARFGAPRSDFDEIVYTHTKRHKCFPTHDVSRAVFYTATAFAVVVHTNCAHKILSNTRVVLHQNPSNLMMPLPHSILLLDIAA